MTDRQELWATENGFDEIIVKTKNRLYDMRGTLDTLKFDVIKFERHPEDNSESKVYLSKKLGLEVPRNRRNDRYLLGVHD